MLCAKRFAVDPIRLGRTKYSFSKCRVKTWKSLNERVDGIYFDIISLIYLRKIDNVFANHKPISVLSYCYNNII